MCGISGEFVFGDTRPSLSGVEAMSAAIHHRGPDDHGVLAEDRAVLAHRRLSIIDLSPRSRQPMESHDGRSVLVFNGEVYNYEELRTELEAAGVPFRTTSDSEVVLHAVQTWGPVQAARRFVGMFAFAVLDRRDGSLSLVRDRVGVKPLFYWMDGARILFGSELRAVLAHPAVPRTADPIGLGQFLTTGYTLGACTAVRGVRRLLPGHVMTVHADGRTGTTCYWSLADHPRAEVDPRSSAELLDELREILGSAFGYRLVSDVPVANFLSGGVDSSLVAAVVSRDLGRDIEHISIGFGEAAFDEVPKAATVAEVLELRHSIHYVAQEEAEAGLERFVEIYDEPFGDTSGIPTALLCRVARERVKVALSADGGDEQFCGYESYARYARAWERLRRLPPSLRGAVATGLGMLPWGAPAAAVARVRGSSLRPDLRGRMDKAFRILGVRTEGDLLRTTYEKAWTWSEAGSLMGVSADDLVDGTVLADDSGATAGEQGFLGRMMRVDYQAFLRDDILTKIDRASMAVSLEARDPFLDHRIAEFAFRLPEDRLFGPGPSGHDEHKLLLKQLLRRWLPPSVVDAPKRGFSIPLYAWMRGIWKEAVLDHLSRDAVRRVGLVDPSLVQRELDAFYGRAGGRPERVWMLLNLHMWWDRWMT